MTDTVGTAYSKSGGSPPRNRLQRICIDEATRKGHVCGTFTRPCIHHGSLHCLACCVWTGHECCERGDHRRAVR